MYALPGGWYWKWASRQQLFFDAIHADLYVATAPQTADAGGRGLWLPSFTNIYLPGPSKTTVFDNSNNCWMRQTAVIDNPDSLTGNKMVRKLTGK